MVRQAWPQQDCLGKTFRHSEESQESGSNSVGADKLCLLNHETLRTAQFRYIESSEQASLVGPWASYANLQENVVSSGDVSRQY